MKKFNQALIILAILAVGIVSCETAGQIDEFNAGITKASLAEWVEAPTDDDDTLDLSAPELEIDFEIQFLDESNGAEVEAFTIDITDGDNSGTFLNVTSFSANEDGNQGFNGSISLNAIVNALGTSLSDYSSGDEFDFSVSLTRGGTEFPMGSSLKAVQDFSLEIQ